MTGGDRLRVLVVDDEPVARRSLRRVLERRPDVEIVGECRDGDEAVEAIWERSPDLVLLDVQMPGLDGFGVLREVGAEAMPPVVFVTAFDEFAVRAFDAAAVDYVMKPYSNARIGHAVDRAVEHRNARDARRLNRQLLATLGTRRDGAPRYPTRLLVRSGKRRVVVDLADVSVIRADDYCARLVSDGKSYRIRRSLDELERRLDPKVFLRVHRSAIVRLNAARAIERVANGEQLVMRDGARIPIGRSRRSVVRSALADLSD